MKPGAPVDWSGMAAFVLSIGVVLFLVAGAALLAIDPRELSPDEATLLSTVLGAVVGAIATYLGMHRATRNHDEKDGRDGE
jgi:hypothetical protein